MATIRVAAVQIDPAIGRVDENLARVIAGIGEAAARGARLVVFPECALSGYCFESAQEARGAAVSVPGAHVEALARAAGDHGVVAVVGAVERAGDELYNAAVVVGEGGLLGSYRKCHLPMLGVDRFVQPGAGPLMPIETPVGRLGLAICYDASFPEVARVLKLRGAQIVVLPTNWPEQAIVSARHQPIVRAHENHVHFVAVNRVGQERGFKFIGHSSIVDCQARLLAVAGEEAPELLLADLDPDAADRNRTVHRTAEYELDRVGDRRPELYGPLVEPIEPAREKTSRGLMPLPARGPIRKNQGRARG